MTEPGVGFEPADYVPDLPTASWSRIRDFVLAVVAEVARVISYPMASVVNAVAHHVDWCVAVAALPLERDTLFRRDVIGAAVAVMPTTQTSTQGRRRSLLLRVGEALGVIPVPSTLPPLAAATPSTPYTEAEVFDLRVWAERQNDADVRSARALVALGLGAGLPTRDLGLIRGLDILCTGRRVSVAGAMPRSVPVRDEFVDELADLASGAGSARLFAPGVAWSKNTITVFVARSLGQTLKPSTQRMRSTWLLAHLSEGMPMQDLLASAGLKSMDALVRYERFLPPSSAVRAGLADSRE